MVGHYFLFKHGTWYSCRDHSEDMSTFDFCGLVPSNPVANAIEALLGMLLDPTVRGQNHLRILFLKLGEDIAAWLVRVRLALHISLLIGITVLWRKLYRHFQAYPWALAPAFDRSRPEAERRSVLESFFALVGVAWMQALAVSCGRLSRPASTST